MDLTPAEQAEVDKLDAEMEGGRSDLEADYGAENVSDDMMHDLADSISVASSPRVRRAFMRFY